MTTFSRQFHNIIPSFLCLTGITIVLCIGCRSTAAQGSSTVTRYSPLTRIRFFPATGQAAGMKGGRFTGSITSATNDFEELVRIEKDVVEGQWNEVVVTGKPLYRFLKYEAQPNTGAAIAEIEFYSGDRKLTGTAFSTVPGDGKTPDAAFDGKTDTTFSAKEVNQQYVGIDLGSAAQVEPVVLSQKGGTYPAPFRLTLSTPTPGAAVRYSWNGEVPREDSGVEYKEPVEIKESGILIAQAFAPGLTRSVPVVTAYRIGASNKPKRL
ncbi:MAG: chitobiase/beta-hexosaminidase C-terminal domain-containing protein, partial [Fibrella sp.]|nr:chitobiase/beta-hexosaminidase C-terminal domain-containing protein [Armatimonadota bacterium]